ncbi:hypothetical protein D9X91_07090 [Falsibacillus albus]|uniref:Uncharacterized protein n=1 Tax=Falsibacillus albus TaxID=2478915 RepID=A0A3L7K1D7_9BACI|nr:hypothetical protein D9X91_07090 [Falsibacillus albus]
MGFRELLKKIDQSVDNHDLVLTRVYIQENIDVLEENRHLLKGNARELFEFLYNQGQDGTKPLSRQEIITINSINSYASKFDLKGIKFCVKHNAPLMLRKDISHYLNADAKIILQGMGAI